MWCVNFNGPKAKAITIQNIKILKEGMGEGNLPSTRKKKEHEVVSRTSLHR